MESGLCRVRHCAFPRTAGATEAGAEADADTCHRSGGAVRAAVGRAAEWKGFQRQLLIFWAEGAFLVSAVAFLHAEYERCGAGGRAKAPEASPGVLGGSGEERAPWLFRDGSGAAGGEGSCHALGAAFKTVLPGAACFQQEGCELRGAAAPPRRAPPCHPPLLPALASRDGSGVLSRPVWKPGGYYKVCAAFSPFLAWWCMRESLQLTLLVLLLWFVEGLGPPGRGTGSR